MPKPFRTALVTATCALLLVACGSDTPATTNTNAPAATTTTIVAATSTTEPSSEATTTAPATTPTAPAGETRVIASSFGDVTVPAKPVRVVALDYAAAVMVEYGLTPVGTTELYEEDHSPELWAGLADIPVVGEWTSIDGLNYEAIAAQRPDMIVGLVRANQADSDELVTLLSPIAPTVLFAANGSQDVLDVTVQIADAVGVGAQAAADRDAFVARAGELTTMYGEQLASLRFALINAYDETEFVVYTPQSWWGPLFDAIGATMVPLTDKVDDNGVWLSVEQIGQLDEASVVLYGLDGGDPRDAVASVLDSPLYQALPVAAHTFGIANLFPDRYTTARAGLDELAAILDQLAG
ncbi:MAG TPA: ABC transporter substrate-binding protein [Ilumatobacteraceae bacterium]|nr:ABC transporter substrate-binding protein [Ilumatobacteraceae bacterium]